MENNVQETAVQNLINELKQFKKFPMVDQPTIEAAIEFAELRLEMEKEQHDNWNKFLETEKTLGISDVKTIERIQWYYNQYFNQTYGK